MVSMVTIIQLPLFLLPHYGQATVTLSVKGTANCDETVTLRCLFTGALANLSRVWRKGSVSIVAGGISTNAKYSEVTSEASGYFELLINNFDKSDEDTYTCKNGVDEVSIAVTCTPPTPGDWLILLLLLLLILLIPIIYAILCTLYSQMVIEWKPPCYEMWPCCRFTKYTKNATRWFDGQIAGIRKICEGKDSYDAKLKKLKDIEKETTDRLSKCKKRCEVEKKNLERCCQDDGEIIGCINVIENMKLQNEIDALHRVEIFKQNNRRPEFKDDIIRMEQKVCELIMICFSKEDKATKLKKLKDLGDEMENNLVKLEGKENDKQIKDLLKELHGIVSTKMSSIEKEI